MEVFGDKQLCPCYKECQEFQKLVELKDSGLVVYCHRPRTGDIRQAEAVENAAKTIRDVFIIYNRKNVKITSSELTSELEKENISCPRCRKTFEHAQELLQEVKSIDRKIVMGICDHCRKKAQGSKIPFCSCDKIVKKFISDKGELKEDTKKYFKTLPLKMEHICKDTMVNKQNAYSDFQIDRGLISPASRHEPEVKQMFSYTHFKTDYIELSKTNKKKDNVKQPFIQSTEPLKTSFARDTPDESKNINTTIPGTSLVDSETTFVEISEGLKELARPSLKDRKQEEIFEDRPSIDAKEALKRRHDLSLRQMLRLEKDSVVPYPVSKKPSIYETPKIAPWAQKEPTSKYHLESEMVIKIPTLKHNRGPRGTRDQDYVSNRETKFRSTRASQDSYYEPRRADKYHHDKVRQGSYDSDEGPKKVKKLEDRYNADKTLKSQRSVDKISHKAKKPEQQLVAKSKSGPIETVGNVPEHKYSFFFPKLMKKEEKKVKGDVSSSLLIKDTQEKIHLQAEKKEKKRQEEERQKKLEQAQKKKLAREEKILQAEEKKRQAERDKKKIEEEQKNFEEEQKKLDEEKKVYKGEQKEVAEQLVDMEMKQDKPERDESRRDVKVKPEKIADVEVTEKGSKDLMSGTLKKESSIALIEENGIQNLRTQNLQKKEEALQKKKVREYEAKVAKAKKEAELKAKKDALEERRLNADAEKEDKLNEEADKAKTELKAKHKQEDKYLAKDQKIKPEREDPDKILQREQIDKENLKKQIDRLRNEKELRKIQAAKDKKELDVPSKKRKADEISMSKIKKSLKKETSGKQETLKVKQGKEKESERKTLKKELSEPQIDASVLQKLIAEQLLEKKKNFKKRELLAHEAEVAKSKKEAELKAKRDAERSRIQMLKQISDENLKLVILKQANKMEAKNISPDVLMIHKCNHQHSAKKSSFCQLCANSELELEVLSLDYKKNLETDKTDIIIGEKIFKNMRRHEKIKEPEGVPILFQKEFCVESDQQLKQILQIIPQETKPEQKQILLTKFEMEPGKGVIRYALSDRTFIDKGWTMLPTEKVVRKMNVYRMRPAHPEFDWFEHNKNKQLMTYDTGERLADFDDNGRGRWYYRSGRLALDYYDAEETNAQQRFVIYSSGEPDERGRTHPITILATFDYLGNGIVFDHAGKIRLKYNQTEGVVLDRGIGPVSHWQWHSLNDPPVLQQVMIDTKIAIKDPTILKLGPATERTSRPDNEEMLAIEFDNFIKEKSKKLTQQFKPFQIRMKAMKINEHFSLKVLDQATVYLIFRDGSTNLKLNIGMNLDHQEIVDTDTAEVGEVSTSLERFPARTDSLASLKRSVAHAQRYERQRAERERWLRPSQPCASADHLTAAASPPMRLPLRTVPTRSSYSTGHSSRKPTNNLYYDTRLCC